MSKREDYISWDEYFMGVALLAAKTEELAAGIHGARA